MHNHFIHDSNNSCFLNSLIKKQNQRHPNKGIRYPSEEATPKELKELKQQSSGYKVNPTKTTNSRGENPLAKLISWPLD